MNDTEIVFPNETLSIEVYPEDGDSKYVLSYHGPNGTDHFSYGNPEDLLSEVRRIVDRRVHVEVNGVDVDEYEDEGPTEMVKDEDPRTLEYRLKLLEERFAALEKQMIMTPYRSQPPTPWWEPYVNPGVPTVTSGELYEGEVILKDW